MLCFLFSISRNPEADIPVVSPAAEKAHKKGGYLG